MEETQVLQSLATYVVLVYLTLWYIFLLFDILLTLSKLVKQCNVGERGHYN